MLLEFNRAMYVVTRIALRLLLGKAKRDSLVRRIWPDSYDFPKPILDLMPNFLRHRWIWYKWERLQEKRHWGEQAVIGYLGQIRGHLFVDVGANFGFYCNKLRKNFERMIAVEADPAIYEELKKRCPSNCEAINIAASNVEAYVSFYRVGEPTGNLGLGIGSLFPPSKQGWNPNAKASHKVKLRAAPLNKILSSEKNVDLVKVDVEGAEWLVLEGAEAIMSRINRWVIELHQPERKSELEGRMAQYGYARSKWLDSGHGVFWRSMEE